MKYPKPGGAFIDRKQLTHREVYTVENSSYAFSGSLSFYACPLHNAEAFPRNNVYETF
jgi:hypothetical protein